MREPMVLRTYKIPEELHALAAARAEEYGDSISEIIRAALAAYALAETAEPEPAPAAEPAPDPEPKNLQWGAFRAP